jgi:hypothetical protein
VNAVTKLSIAAMQLQTIRVYLQEELNELIDLRNKVAKVELQSQRSRSPRRASSQWCGPIRVLTSEAWQNHTGRRH